MQKACGDDFFAGFFDCSMIWVYSIIFLKFASIMIYSLEWVSG